MGRLEHKERTGLEDLKDRLACLVLPGHKDPWERWGRRAWMGHKAVWVFKDHRVHLDQLDRQVPKGQLVGRVLRVLQVRLEQLQCLGRLDLAPPSTA